MAEIPRLEQRVPPEVLSTGKFDALHPRLLLTGDAINPDKTDIPEIGRESLRHFLSRDYGVFDKASTEERENYWTQTEKITDRAQQKTKWLQDTVKTFQNGREYFTNDATGKRWSGIYSQFGIDAKNVSNAQLETFYKTYFALPDRKSDIKRFIADVVFTYRKPDQTIDNAQLQADLPGIQWLANTFGEISSEVILHLIDAEIKLEAKPDELITKANADSRINKPNTDEKRILQFLWRAQKDLPAEEEEQERRDLGRPTEPDPDIKREDVGSEKRNRKYIIQYRGIDTKNEKGEVIRNFPEEVGTLTDPYNVAYNLQRNFPRYSARNIDELAQEVVREEQDFKIKMAKMDLHASQYGEFVRKNLADYGGFLKEYFSITLPTVNDLTIIPLHGKKAELLNPGGRALAYVSPKYPAIFIDFDMINRYAPFFGKGRFETLDPQEQRKLVQELLQEVQPHEYTHVMGHIANWHLFKRGETKAKDIAPGRMGLFLMKPGRPPIGLHEQFLLKERGRGIMEAVTVELTDQWMQARKNKTLLHKSYPAERALLHTLIAQLSREKHVQPNDVFKKFVEAYFKEDGLRDLNDFITGRTVKPTGEKYTFTNVTKYKDGPKKGQPIWHEEGSQKDKVKIAFDKNRRHFLPIIEALMEYEITHAARGGLTNYSLTEHYITDNLNAAEKAQLLNFVDTYTNPTKSHIQLSKGALDEIRAVVTTAQSGQAAA